MDELRFIVPGKPVGKERPRVVTSPTGKSISYTPRKTTDYEELVRIMYLQASGGAVFVGAVMVEMVAVFERPKNRKVEDSDEKYTQKPDADNIEKAILDGLNKTAWKDDAAVYDIHIRKAYGKKAQVLVRITGNVEKNI